jgi:hypothetical protein
MGNKSMKKNVTILSHQGNANQNYTEIPPHSSPNGYHPESKLARHQWLIPVILTTQEAEIRRIEVQSQAKQIVLETLS